jgi:tetratricopeptide (TPR) repeat protein
MDRRMRWDLNEYASILLLGLILFLVLFAGGVHPWTSFSFHVGVAAAALVWIIGSWKKPLRIPSPYSFLFLLPLFVIYLVPLPHGILQSLTPQLEGWRGEAFALFDGKPGSFHSMTLVPELTRVTFQKVYAWVLLVWIASSTFHSKLLLERLCRLASILGGSFALIALLQSFSKAKGIFWLFEATHGFYGTLISHNHAAFLLALLAPFSLTWFLTAQNRQTKILSGLLFVFMTLGCAFSMSRGGMLLFALGSLLTLYFQRKAQGLHLKDAILLLFVLVGYFLLLGVQEISSELFSLKEVAFGRELRFELWGDSLAAWKEAIGFGYGPGTFHEIFPAFRTSSGYLIFEHAENEWIELLVVTGLFGGALLLLFITTLFSSIIRIRRTWGKWDGAVFTGLVLFVVGSLFQFVFTAPLFLLLSAIWVGILLRGGEKSPSCFLVRSHGFHFAIVLTVLVSLLLSFQQARYHHYLNRGDSWKAWGVFPSGFEANARISRSLIQEDKIDDLPMIRDFAEQALIANPLSIEAIVALAYAYQKAGQIDQAIKTSHYGIKVNPFYPPLFLALGDFLASSKRCKEALPHYHKALDLSRGWPTGKQGRIHQAISTCLVELGQFDKALKEARLSSTSKEDSARSWKFFRIALRKGDIRAALKYAGMLVRSKGSVSDSSVIRALIGEVQQSSHPVQDFISTLALKTKKPEAILEACKLLPKEEKEEIWEGDPYLAFPTSLMKKQWKNLIPAKRTREVIQAIPDPNSGMPVLNLSVVYQTSSKMLDWWGVILDLPFVSDKWQVRLLVKGERKLGKQLLVEVGGVRFNTGSKVKKTKGGWSQIDLPLGQVLAQKKIEPAVPLRIGFNTGMLDGMYQIQPIQLYLP